MFVDIQLPIFNTRGSENNREFKDAVQSVCKQRLCLHFGIQNIEFYSTTIYISRWGFIASKTLT